MTKVSATSLLNSCASSCGGYPGRLKYLPFCSFRRKKILLSAFESWIDQLAFPSIQQCLMGNQETTSRKRTEVYAHEESRRVKYQLTLWYSLDDSCDNSTRNGNFELELHQLRGPVFIARRLEVSHFTGDFVCLQSSEIQLRAQKCDTKVYEAYAKPICYNFLTISLGVYLIPSLGLVGGILIEDRIHPLICDTHW